MDDREFEARLKARIQHEFGAAHPSDDLARRTLAAMRAEANPGRGTSLRMLIGAAAVLIGAVAVVILRSAPTGPAATQLPSAPAVSAPFSSPSPSPLVTATPSPSQLDKGMPEVAVASAAVRVVPIPETLAVQAGAAPTGPYAYLRGDDWTTLFVADAGGGSVRTVPVPLAAGEQIRDFSADGRWLVLLAARPGDPCTPQPTATQIRWRILAARLGSDGLPEGAFRQIDVGVASRSFILPGGQGLSCVAPAVPPFAMAAGRVAYGVEAPNSADPAASEVQVRSLADRSIVRTIAAPAQVYSMTLSSSAVAWVETANGVTNGQVADWRVMEASLPGGAVRAVPLGETAGAAHMGTPGIVLDGNALVASLDQYAFESGTVVRVEGDRIVQVDPGISHRQCMAVGAEAGLIVLGCNGSVVQGNTTNATWSWLATWSSTSGLRAVVGDVLPTNQGAILLADGWVLQIGQDAAGRSVLVAVPMSALQ